MNIARNNTRIKISGWNEYKILRIALTSIIGAIAFYFLEGLGSGIIAGIVFFIFNHVGYALIQLTHYSTLEINYKEHSILASSWFKKLVIKDIDYTKLKFKDMKQGGKGFKKYILEYDGKMVYRVNKAEQKEAIEQIIGSL